jgi:hypothetical protein
VTSASWPVGLDHERDVAGLDRDLDVVEADLVEVGELLLRRLDHGLRGHLAAVLGVQLGVEAAAVHPDRMGTLRAFASARCP